MSSGGSSRCRLTPEANLKKVVGCVDRQSLRQLQVRREVLSDPVTPARRLDARGATGPRGRARPYAGWG